MPALAKAYGRVLEVCGVIAALLVFAMTALIVADVALRNIFRVTLPASVELTEYAMFFASAFAAPWLLRRGQHIRVDFVMICPPLRMSGDDGAGARVLEHFGRYVARVRARCVGVAVLTSEL